MMPAILYVDDEQANLAVFEAAFEDFYEVYVAESAAQAVAVLRTEHIDLVITDQRMPEMTGVQLLESIAPDFPDMVRMILTGYSDIQAIIHAINTGRLEHYLTKPYEPATLKITMDRAIELQAAQRRNRELSVALERAADRATSMREAFQKYVPPEIVAELVGGSSEVMCGESRQITALFTRICGFRDRTAGLTPEQVVGFMDAYVSAMNRLILKHGGLLATASDELFAAFGVPVDKGDHEKGALACALDMREAMKSFNEAHAIPLFGEPLQLAMGLHRGEVIAGNVGGARRMQYGVIGDTVNTAARIKSHAKPGEILCSEAMVEHIDAGVEAVGSVQLRGKPEPTNLFKVS